LSDVVAPLPADREAAELEEPSDRALGNPAEPPEFLAGLDAFPRDSIEDAPLLEVGVTAGDVVGLVGVEFLGPNAGPATRAPDRLDQFDQRLEQLAVVVVGRGLPGGQRRALPVDQDVLLRARLAPIGRVRPGFGPPFFARRLPESRLARLQSIRSAAPRRSSSTVWSRCQTLARFQSRSRRQQVMPLPQTISRGRYSQGSPVVSTKMMPVRAARSGTRGRPPWGLGGSFGSSGSMLVQSWSVTSCFAMPTGPFKIRATRRRFC